MLQGIVLEEINSEYTQNPSTRQASEGDGLCNRRTWRTCLPCLGRGGGQATTGEGDARGAGKGIEAGAAGAGKGGAAAAPAPKGSRAGLPKLAVPKLNMPSFRQKYGEGAAPTPRDTARSMNGERTPRSPGVLYVDHP